MLLKSLVTACCLIAMTAFAVAGEGEIALPQPRHHSHTGVEDALRARRSVRQYKPDALSMNEISEVLWAAQGITDVDGNRTAPSAGALYPLEVYVVATNVDKLKPGVYRYDPEDHALAPVLDGDYRAALAKAAGDQESVAKAPAALVITAVYARTAKKYGDRAPRYAHIEVGCAVQNVYLEAEVLNMGTVMVGAFDDDAVAQALKLPVNEAPLAIMPLGRD